MADTRYHDSQTSFQGGMQGGFDAGHVADDQYAQGLNLICRKGVLNCRPAFEEIPDGSENNVNMHETNSAYADAVTAYNNAITALNTAQGNVDSYKSILDAAITFINTKTPYTDITISDKTYYSELFDQISNQLIGHVSPQWTFGGMDGYTRGGQNNIRNFSNIILFGPFNTGSGHGGEQSVFNFDQGNITDELIARTHHLDTWAHGRRGLNGTHYDTVNPTNNRPPLNFWSDGRLHAWGGLFGLQAAGNLKINQGVNWTPKANKTLGDFLLKILKIGYQQGLYTTNYAIKNAGFAFDQQAIDDLKICMLGNFTITESTNLPGGYYANVNWTKTNIFGLPLTNGNIHNMYPGAVTGQRDIGLIPNHNFGAAVVMLKIMYEFIQRADFTMECEQRVYNGFARQQFKTTGAYQTFQNDPTGTVVTGSISGATATVSQIYPTRNSGNTTYYYNNIDLKNINGIFQTGENLVSANGEVIKTRKNGRQRTYKKHFEQGLNTLMVIGAYMEYFENNHIVNNTPLYVAPSSMTKFFDLTDNINIAPNSTGELGTTETSAVSGNPAGSYTMPTNWRPHPLIFNEPTIAYNTAPVEIVEGTKSIKVVRASSNQNLPANNSGASYALYYTAGTSRKANGAGSNPAANKLESTNLRTCNLGISYKATGKLKLDSASNFTFAGALSNIQPGNQIPFTIQLMAKRQNGNANNVATNVLASLQNVNVTKDDWTSFEFSFGMPASTTINGVLFDSFYLVFRNPDAYNVDANFDLTGGKIKGTECTFYIDDLKIELANAYAIEPISTITAWSNFDWFKLIDDRIEDLAVAEQNQDRTLVISKNLFSTPGRLFKYGLYQGASIYENQSQKYIACVFSGHIFLVNINNYGKICLTNEDTKLDPYVERVYIEQVENFLIIQDGINNPKIIDGTTMRASNYNEDGTPKDGFDEIPVGTNMAYGQGRLSVQISERSILIGDIYQIFNKENVLQFTETQFLNEGGGFTVSGKLGNIVALQFANVADTSTGDGPLLAICENGFSTFAINNPRATWSNIPIQKIQLLGTSIVGPEASVNVNEDIFYRSHDGIRSYRVGIGEANSGFKYSSISTEVRKFIENDNNFDVQFNSMDFFDNRLLALNSTQNINTELDNYGYYHQLAVTAFNDVQTKFVTAITDSSNSPNANGPPAWTALTNIVKNGTGHTLSTGASTLFDSHGFPSAFGEFQNPTELYLYGSAPFFIKLTGSTNSPAVNQSYTYDSTNNKFIGVTDSNYTIEKSGSDWQKKLNGNNVDGIPAGVNSTFPKSHGNIVVSYHFDPVDVKTAYHNLLYNLYHGQYAYASGPEGTYPPGGITYTSRNNLPNEKILQLGQEVTIDNVTYNNKHLVYALSNQEAEIVGDRVRYKNRIVPNKFAIYVEFFYSAHSLEDTAIASHIGTTSIGGNRGGWALGVYGSNAGENQGVGEYTNDKEGTLFLKLYAYNTATTIIDFDYLVSQDPGAYNVEYLIPNQVNKVYFEFDSTANTISYRINEFSVQFNNQTTTSVTLSNQISNYSQVGGSNIFVGGAPDNNLRGRIETGTEVGNSIQAKFYRFFYYNSNMTGPQKAKFLYGDENQYVYYDTRNTTDAIYFEEIDDDASIIRNQVDNERPAIITTNFTQTGYHTDPIELIKHHNTEPLPTIIGIQKYQSLASYAVYTDNFTQFSRHVFKLETLMQYFKVSGYEDISDLCLSLKTYSEAIEKQEAHIKHSVIHKGLISYDFNLAGYTKNTRTSSSARLKSGSYDGIWTGVNAYKILSVIDNGIKRCFVIGKNSVETPNTYVNEKRSKYENIIKEIKPGDNDTAQDKENYTTGYDGNIIQTYTSRLMPYKSENTYIDAPFIYKHLDEFILFLSQLEGNINAKIFVKTDVINKFTQIGTLSLQAPLMTNNDPQTLGAPQNRTMLRLKDFTEQYESSTNLPIRNGNEFQFKIEWTGKMSIRRILTSARQISQPREENIETSSAVFPLDTSQDFSYGSLNN
jgi:hypothetical protein